MHLSRRKNDMLVREKDYLMHYGVLGMKWGVHRAAKKDSNVRKAKKEYKQASREYNRSFNKAYNRSIAAYSPIKKHRENNDKRWNEAYDKAQNLRKAKETYKKTKKEAEQKVVNKLYSKQNSKSNKAIANMSTGAAIAQSMLLGSYGAMKYNEARAKGKSTGRSVAEGILKNWGNNMLFGIPGAMQYLENRGARKKR